MGKILQNDRILEQASIYDSLTSGDYGDVRFRPSGREEFLFIESLEQSTAPSIAYACGLIIRNLSKGEILEVIRNIRISTRPEVYLKPIFLQSTAIYEELKFQVDGCYNPNNVQLLKEEAMVIHGRIDKLPNVQIDTDLKTSVTFKAVQYLHTRAISTLEPYRTRSSNIGYALPFISSFSYANENIKLFRLLKEAVEEGLMEQTVVDKVNLCKDCQGSYLNFREVCPKCHGLDLTAEPLVHHFRCAHVAPESDFKEGFDMVCPKCDREMRHIGIDYDKPSEIILCNNCNHHTQNPLMEASCVDCGSVMNLERIDTIEICQYHLNPKGEQLVKYGNALDANEPIKQSHHLEPTVFKLLLEQEWKKIQVKGHKSFLFKLNLVKESISFLSPKDQKQLALECLDITKNYFRAFDLFSFSTDEIIWVLMTEVTTNEAEEMANLVKNNLEKLIQDNFEATVNYVELAYHPLQFPLPPAFVIVPI